MKRPFFTIGHSNRSTDAFVELLKRSDIELIADVRKMPMSRSNPQFNVSALPAALAPFGIAYEHIAALGGLRGKTKTAPAEQNAFWENKSFHNYADYALTEPFHLGMRHLLAKGAAQRCAIMCSEALWWRCHRRIIADYLIAAGESVFHILNDRVEPARLTAGADVQPDGTIVYPVRP